MSTYIKLNKVETKQVNLLRLAVNPYPMVFPPEKCTVAHGRNA